MKIRLRVRSAACGLVLLAAAVAPAAEQSWIRVNQVGYLPDDPKIAVLSSDVPLSGEYSIGDHRASIGPDQGAWGPFAHNYRLDFSSVRSPGRYRIKFGDVTSPEFAIGERAYDGVPDKLLEFMQLQRCGENPITGKKCHQEDGYDTTSGEMVDLVGGWHDAGDRLKHMITTTYCVAALFLADANDEARHGAALVKKLHPAPEVLYVQIGDDRDHMPPNTLWHDDQSDYGRGPGGPRAAWRATGAPEGPKYQNKSSGLANLAGRSAAAMVLAGDLEAAKSLYKLAQAKPGVAMSVPVRAPYYYGESSCFDDLEWAATELHLATGEKQYLDYAIRYADQAGDNPWMGADKHGHYEFFPYVNLAHWRLYPHVDGETQKRLAGYYRAGLERIQQRAEQNPYRLGTPLVWCSTNDVVALATQARLYELMTGDTTYRPLAAEARDWIFGRNPWGVSMVIGVPENGRHASRPHHLFYKLANHLPVGGLVDGPVSKAINDSLKFDTFSDPELEHFQSDVAVYHDQFADFSTNEPIIDGTVSLLLLLHVWEPQAAVVREPHGAIIRGDTSKKQLALVFTGDSYANGATPILDVLRERGVKAGFFLTGNFLRNPEFRPAIERMRDEGHYIGPHSDSHPLYCDWTVRDKSLVSRQAFTEDLNANLAALRTVGALAATEQPLFIPPYEWYNREQAAWCKELGVKLINFTPGSGSNRDYAPEGDRAFVSSTRLRDDILAYEQRDEHGLNGFILLLHVGAQREDLFHTQLGSLCDELRDRGYEFVRVDRLLGHSVQSGLAKNNDRPAPLP
ncbi:MAG: glycoside hydrolase family 9 protein [Pirellulales bacterium]